MKPFIDDSKRGVAAVIALTGVALLAFLGGGCDGNTPTDRPKPKPTLTAIVVPTRTPTRTVAPPTEVPTFVPPVPTEALTAVPTIPPPPVETFIPAPSPVASGVPTDIGTETP